MTADLRGYMVVTEGGMYLTHSGDWTHIFGHGAIFHSLEAAAKAHKPHCVVTAQSETLTAPAVWTIYGYTMNGRLIDVGVGFGH